MDTKNEVLAPIAAGLTTAEIFEILTYHIKDVEGVKIIPRYCSLKKI
jgi:hypothetical protein